MIAESIVTGARAPRADWQVKPLGDLLTFLTSGSRGWAKHYSDSGGFFLRIQNVGRNKMLLDDVAFVSAPDTAEARRTLVQPGDVLLSITADLGRTGVVPDGLGPAYINQHLAILRVAGVYPPFLSAYLASPEGQKQVLGRNRTGVKAGLNFEDVRSFRIPIPPLAEQQRIAEVLDRAEALRAKRLDAIAQLDTLSQAIFLDVFGDPDANPKVWPTKTLDALCRSITDIDHKMPVAAEEGVPFISAKDLSNDGQISFKNVKRISEADYRRLSRKSRPERGDIIYSRIGINLGKARRVEVDFEFVASYSCCTIKPNRELVDATYLCSLLDSPFMLRQAHKGVRAIAVPDLGLGEIKAFKIIVPPIDLQRTFTRRLTAVEQVKGVYRKSLVALDTLFASLQHRAFRGEL